MPTVSNQVLLMGAAGILALGAAWAGAIYRAAPAYHGPDPAQLGALAARVKTAPAPETVLDAVPAKPAVVVTKTPQTVDKPKAKAAPVKPVVAVSKPAPKVPPAAATTAAVSHDEAVKNIALTGVTHENGQDMAWLIDVSSRDRTAAEKGESAFGFTVKEIQPEAVLLTRGSDEFLVRMGDKQVPVVYVASAETSSDDGEGFGGGFGGRGGRGGGFGGRGGFGGFGGRGGFSGFGGRGGFGGFGGGNFGGGNFGGGGGGFSGSSSSSSSNSGQSQFGNRFGGGGFGGGGFSGGFGGGGFSGFGGGGFGGSSSSSRTSATNQPTSNPQTARRRGSRLTGGATPMPTPDPITNPQTQRRNGGTSGPAFGDTTSTGNRGGTYGGSTTYGGSNRGNGR